MLITKKKLTAIIKEELGNIFEFGALNENILLDAIRIAVSNTLEEAGLQKTEAIDMIEQLTGDKVTNALLDGAQDYIRKLGHTPDLGPKEPQTTDFI